MRDAQPLRMMHVGIILALLAACAVAITACAPAAPPGGGDKTMPFGGGWNDNSNDNEPSADLTPPVPLFDLGTQSSTTTMTPTPAGQTGCHGYAACYGSCNLNSQTNAQYASCSSACDAHASTAAVSAINNTFNCGITACMQIGWCTSLNDQSDNCGACAYNAVAAMFGMPCDSGAPVCNAQQCSAQITSCLSALP